jgi:hypothetical protein
MGYATADEIAAWEAAHPEAAIARAAYHQMRKEANAQYNAALEKLRAQNPRLTWGDPQVRALMVALTTAIRPAEAALDQATIGRPFFATRRMED